MPFSLAMEPRDTVYGSDLASRWDDLINWTAREASERDFFSRILRSHRVETVVDVACGTGFHAISLARQGFRVSASDASPAMVDRTVGNAAKHGVRLSEARVAAWNDLPATHGAQAFDAVLCLGNSFTHLFGHEARRDAIQAMRTLLRPGGILVIDHRNYDLVLDGRLNSDHRYYYCGDGVETSFDEISRHRINLAHAFSDGATFDFCLYPLKQGYVAHLLEDAGLVECRRFGDFSADHDPGTVSFFQHVAVLPDA